MEGEVVTLNESLGNATITTGDPGSYYFNHTLPTFSRGVNTSLGRLRAQTKRASLKSVS